MNKKILIGVGVAVAALLLYLWWKKRSGAVDPVTGNPISAAGQRWLAAHSQGVSVKDADYFATHNPDGSLK